jgi:hypothetical protein
LRLLNLFIAKTPPPFGHLPLAGEEDFEKLFLEK